MDSTTITRAEARAIAKAIYKDIKLYIQEHQAEYECFAEAPQPADIKGDSVDE